ncbi:PDLIM7, partial [Cervus elaphus hippelaphus]
MDSFKVVLEGPAPWGFRLQGGKDFNVPLSISRLTPGGKAAQAGVAVGDWVLSIDGENAGGLTHIEAQNKIRACGERLSLSLSSSAGSEQTAEGPGPRRGPPAVHLCTQRLPQQDGPAFRGEPVRRQHPAAEWVQTPDKSVSPLCLSLSSFLLALWVVAPPHSGCRPLTLIALLPSHFPTPPLTQQGPGLAHPSSRHSPTCIKSGEGPPLLPVQARGSEPHPPHRQPLRPLVPDASKQRLMEDTEDWRPRPGTGQSRSFRILAHLTGTEFMQDPDEEHMKKSREKYVLELQSPRYTRLRDWHHQRSAHVLNVCAGCLGTEINILSPAFSASLLYLRGLGLHLGSGVLDGSDPVWALPVWVSVGGGTQQKGALPAERPSGMGGGPLQAAPGSPRCSAVSPGTPMEPLFLALAGPATPSPTSRPPWAVDPAFAERYAPDKTSTVLTRHTQPATPTPMQNRTSIVQAAAGGGHGGGGGGDGKTPVCHQCHRVIRGRYLVALGHAYHPEEFVCSQCGKVLEEGGFFEEKGAIFCPPCYDVRYAPSCAKCKKKITGEIMHALKMTWHVHCFTCAACKTPIRNRAFYMEEGAPYCE